MLHIVTGQIDEGKTTKLLSIFDETKCGDGFINQKVFIDGVNAGQEIMRLSTREKRYFSFREGFLPDCWNEKYQYGAYSFSKEGYEFAEKVVWNVIRDTIEPVFIDEIGPLELGGKGFHDLFFALLKENMEMYVAVRESCVDDVIKKFGIENSRLIFVC